MESSQTTLTEHGVETFQEIPNQPVDRIGTSLQFHMWPTSFKFVNLQCNQCLPCGT